MTLESILPFIFNDPKDVEVILQEDANDLYQYALEYGFSTKKLLYLDYKGEEGREIVNYIMDYEMEHNIELAGEEQLEELDELEYDYLQDKLRLANHILAPSGYGLFLCPTFGDYVALFLAKLEYKEALLKVDVLDDEFIPEEARYIEYIID